MILSKTDEVENKRVEYCIGGIAVFFRFCVSGISLAALVTNWEGATGYAERSFS